MPDLPRQARVVAEDGRAGMVDRKHDGFEHGPAGDFYAVLFDGAASLEWIPGAALHLEAAPGRAAWLAERRAEAEARSAKAAADNVERDKDGLPIVIL